MSRKARLSQEFIRRLKLSLIPAAVVARHVGIHPRTLTKYTRGSLKPQLNDERLVHAGAMLGLKSDDVFTTKEL